MGCRLSGSADLKVSHMKRLVLLSSLVLVGFSSAVWSQANQQPAPAPAAAPQPNPENFVGKVTGHPTTDIRMLRYSFEPGARTNWHSHEGGQVILIEKGHARVQEAGGADARDRARASRSSPRRGEALARRDAERAADAGVTELRRDELDGEGHRRAVLGQRQVTIDARARRRGRSSCCACADLPPSRRRHPARRSTSGAAPRVTSGLPMAGRRASTRCRTCRARASCARSTSAR